MSAINQGRLCTIALLLPFSALIGFPLVKSRPTDNDKPYLMELKSLRYVLHNKVIPGIEELYGHKHKEISLSSFKRRKIESIKRYMEDSSISELEALKITLRLTTKFYQEIKQIKEIEFESFNVYFYDKQIEREKIMNRLIHGLDLVNSELNQAIEDILDFYPKYTLKHKKKLLEIQPDFFGNIMDIDFNFIDFLNRFLDIAIKRFEDE
ncbi:uncharacterized protein LOC126734594 [Anthonomus grandis grandis]|uniref:uncharacterized protein LOC126734594 n=1 Tax=Anthonomus grandis grandis TaxID=2921223 RepID=UPI002165102E|nr:uncharacterized protein LOC126734594 [Anthonomus grandis grandis]